MYEFEGIRIEVKGRVLFDIDLNNLVILEEFKVLIDEEIRVDIEEKFMKIVLVMVGEDEYLVGLREIIDIKYGGIEKYGIECYYLGIFVFVEKLVDVVIELNVDVIFVFIIISYDDIYYKNMKKLYDYCVEKGIRDKVMIVCGGI